MPPSPPPLRIAILGAGNIGSAFAFQLARAGGHAVTVVARPNSPRLAQLQRDQAIIDSRGERAAVSVADRLDEATPFDLVIVTVLAHQVAPLLPALQRSAAACIQFMFNTFEPERLQAAIGPERCALGMPFIQARLEGEGRLRFTAGAGGQKSLISRQASVDLFNAAGLPAALESDMPLWLRCHAPLCVALESVSVAGMRRGGGASFGETLTLAHGVRASFALIRARGYPIYPPAKARIATAPVWLLGLVLWGLSRIAAFRALLAQGEGECRVLVEVMASAAPPGFPAGRVAQIRAMAPS